MTRLSDPNLTIPASFAEEGQKADFSTEKVRSGFSSIAPETLAGDNLNKLIDDTYKGLTYSIGSIADLYSSVIWYDCNQTYNKDSLVFGKVDEEIGLYTSLQDSNINNSLTDEAYWSKTPLGNNGSARNIGELVQTLLPQTDAGLHLVDGALISGNGIYSQFVDYVAGLYAKNPKASYFTTETDWQNSVKNYGVCAKFVYNSANRTVRLPKVTGLVEGTIDINALGQLVQAGLPALSGRAVSNGAHTHTRGTMEIKGALRFYGTSHGTNRVVYSASGAFTAEDATDVKSGVGTLQTDPNVRYQLVNFYASNKWSGATSSNGAHTHEVNITDNNGILGKSNTVQPRTVKGFLYIVIGTYVKSSVHVNIDKVATDLNNKVDKDFSNITWSNEMRQIVANVVGNGLVNQIATEDIQGIVMPDNITIQVSENGTLSTIMNPDEYYTKTEVDSKVANIYRYKGTVASYNNLPTANLMNGDVYNVQDTGKNYAWVGISEACPDGWDALGGVFDLTNFYTKTEVDNMLSYRDTQITNLSSYILNLQQRVTSLETLIQGGNA